ncbi:MFS transporter [Alphaproteobacteria bacterium]|nr:MFS transporter [Alphaproteobacteria bacterium]
MEDTSDQPARWRDVFVSGNLTLIAVLFFALWLHASNSMLTATTMPTAALEIGGLHLISWTFALYLMGSIVAGASMGLVVLKFGLKRTMLMATLVYIIGSTLCALAPSMPIMLVGRTIQGLGGGSLVALVYVATDRFFPNRLLPKIIGLTSLLWLTATLSGPAIGGAFATAGIWRWSYGSFAIQAVFLIVAILILVKDEGKDTSKEPTKIPFVRLFWLAVSIFAVSLAGAEFHIWRSPLFVIVGCVALAFFLMRDKKSVGSRMFPVEVTDLSHPIGNGLLMTFCFCLSIMSFLVYGPLILMELHGLNPLYAGYIVAAESAAWGSTALVFANAGPRLEKWLLRLGGLAIAGGTLAMAFVLASGPIWLIVVAAAVGNAGMGMMWGFIIKNVIHSAKKEDKERASTSLPSVQQMGFALGAALSGLIANSIGLGDGLTEINMKAASFWLFAAFVPLLLVGNIAGWRFVSKLKL